MKNIANILYWASLVAVSIPSILVFAGLKPNYEPFLIGGVIISLACNVVLFILERENVSGKDIAGTIREENPYPTSVFSEVSDMEKQAVSDLLIKNGYSPDRIFGSFGRGVWDRCCKQIELEYE